WMPTLFQMLASRRRWPTLPKHPYFSWLVVLSLQLLFYTCACLSWPTIIQNTIPSSRLLVATSLRCRMHTRNKDSLLLNT
ncbi:MAG: hypothetical protein M1823_007412, partial [Watsoniomyces obsoletus]